VIFRVLTRLLFACTVGIILSLWIIQNNESVKKKVSTSVISFLEQEWKTRITIDGTKINFFTLSLLFKNGQIQSTQKKDFAWRFDQCRVHISLLDLLFKQAISLHLTFNDIRANTSYHNKDSDLLGHIGDIFKIRTGTYNIALRGLTINSIDLSVRQPSDTNDTSKQSVFLCHLPGVIHVEKTSSSTTPYTWFGSVKLHDAALVHNDNALGHRLNGTVSFYQARDTQAWHFTTSLHGSTNFFDPQTAYTLQGTWDPTHKEITLYDQAKSVNLAAALVSNQSRLSLKGTLPLTFVYYGAHWFKTGIIPTEPPSWLSGTCWMDLALGHETYPSIAGTLTLTNVKIGQFPLQQIQCNLAGTNDAKAYSEISIVKDSASQLVGTGFWDWKENGGQLTVTNTTPLALAFGNEPATAPLTIYSRDLSLKVACNSGGTLNGWYRCTVVNPTTEQRMPYKGAFLFNNNLMNIKGTAAKGDYLISAALWPQPHLLRWHYGVHGKTLVDVAANPHDPFIVEGSIQWPFIRSMLSQDIKQYIFNNNCSFMVTLDQHSLQQPHGCLRLAAGTFFIPNFHNLISTFQSDFAYNVAGRKLTLDKTLVGFSQGHIMCPHATVTLNEQWEIDTLHAPCAIHNMFLNWKRDLYGLVYGTLTLNKPSGALPQAIGTLVLKKSLLKDTIFGSDSSSPLTGSVGGTGFLPCGFDIKLLTEKPIKAKTASIEALASANLRLRFAPQKDVYATPCLSGSIDLTDGTLKLLNNKLHIEYGKIQFVANKANDPLIDLIAKSRIGKFLVTLQVTGSQQKPTILLESTPDLSEEQIIGLLLAGSENATLQESLPLMIMKNLDSFVFGDRKKNKTISWLDKISKTFKYIQITPDFGDQTTVGKLKGSISVNVSDQLRAQIQKNIDFDKDFSAQLEYMLSDDINIKVVKDQCGELGSEVEMRLKLG